MGKAKTALGLALVLVAGLTSACGSDGTKAVTQPAVTEPAVSQRPIVLGMYNQEGVPTGSFEGLRQAAEAAVEYINKDLHGVGGRQLKLDVCITRGSPASTNECATQLIQKKPVAIIGGVDFTSFAGHASYTQSKIPTIGGAAFSDLDMKLPNSFRFSGGSASGLSGGAVFVAKNLKAKKVALIYANNQSARNSVDTFQRPVLRKLGVSIVDITTEPAPPDYTPYLQQAVSQGVDAVLVLPPTPSCVNVMQAYKTLGLSKDVAMFLPGICAGPVVIKQAGAAADGVYFSAIFREWDKSNSDTKLFDQKIAKYITNKNFNLDDLAAYGVNGVMNAYDAFKRIGGDKVNPTSISASFRGAKNAHNFLGYPYTCDGKQLSGRPAVCMNKTDIVVARDGRLVGATKEAVDASPYLTGPTG